MKIKLLFCLVFSITASFGQTITFTDISLKNKLLSASTTNYVAADSNNNSIKIDVNNDGEIQITEALAVYKLSIFNSNINNLGGIQYFTNLTSLSAYNNNLQSVDLSSLVNLVDLKLSNNLLQTLDVQSLPMLKILHADYNNLTSLNVAGLNNIEQLWVRNNALTSLNISGPSYKNVAFSDNSISQFNVAALPNLQVISCGGNPLSTLDFQSMPNLVSFLCEECNIPNVDLSNSPGIIVLMVTNSEAVQTINIKNGNIAEIMDEWQVFGLPNLQYMCIDEGEGWFFDIIFGNLPDDQKPNINSYCTAGPGGEHNLISGTFRFDTNSNGCDATDGTLPFVKLTVSDGTTQGHVFTNSQGHYAIPVIEGSYTITPVLDNDFNISPASVVVAVTTVDNSTIAHDFCVTPNGNNNDITITMVPVDGARPGFDATYKILIENKGNQTADGTVTITFPDNVVDYIDSNLTPTISNNTLSFTFSGLLPFEKRESLWKFNVNSPMETPAVNIDNILGYTTVVTSNGDQDISNNTSTLRQTVVGSFDPNDIACLEGETVHPDKIGGYLHYNVNFENTGNFPATFIVVKNEINAQQFDVTTLEVVSASHPMATTITGNKVEFRFDDINLEALGKGNIVYRIKTVPTVAVNATVTQNAEIFFDYNFPIETNDANTTFTILNSGGFVKDNSAAVYPNPSGGILNIKAETAVNSIEVYDVQGRLLQAGTSNSIDITERAAGIYYVKIKTDAGIKTEKVVKL